VVELAVVVIVSVAVPAALPVMFAGVVEPKLSVGWTPPDGPVVIAEVNATLPVNPPTGVRVIAEVFPEVAPAVTVTGLPVMVKPGVMV
jgi:hypothetical protein